MTCLVLLGALTLSFPAHAEAATPDVGRGAVGLGVNYPGLGLKYFMTDDYAVEAKAQAAGGDKIYGGRAYRYFRLAPPIFLLGGFEADYVNFKGAIGKGSGYAGEAFFGFEYFVAPRVTLEADLGPAYVYLKDSRASLSASGLEFVTNVGINVYFGRRR